MKKQEEEKAFEQLVRDHELLIYKVCRVYAYSDADRKDLFQEVVIQLWQSYQKFRGEAKMSTWIYRVAINTAITGVRRQRNFITTYEPSMLPTDEKDTNDAEANEERWRQLNAAIEKLNEIEKAIIMLFLEEKTYDDMEDILGISQGNLRVKMSRIKEKLRQLTKQ